MMIHRPPTIVLTLLLAAWMASNLGADAPAIRLATPASGSGSAIPFPGFSWNEDRAAFEDMARPVEYEIEISQSAGFETTVDKDRVALNRYVPDKPLAPGTYHWRVRALPYQGHAWDWSAPSSFLIREPDVVFAVDAGKNIVEAAREVLAKARAESGRSVRIVVPAGNYDIPAPFEGYLFDLEDLSNIVIDGTGADLHFSTRKQGLIRAKHCSDVAILGFNSFFAKGALRVQGTIKGIDAPGRRLTVEVEPGYPGFDASDNPRHDIFYFLQPETAGRLKTGAPNFIRATSEIRREADRIWSFTIRGDTGFCKVGDRFGYNFRSGSAHLVDFSESRGTTAYGLTTTGWGGMQFVSVEGSDFRILHCQTRFGEGEWMTGNADGVHIRGHALGPWIESTRIQAIGDDSVALYARPASMKSPDPAGNSRVALCRKEFFNLEAGDEVSFFQPREGRILLETTVENVSPHADGYQVAFADPLPAGLRYQGPVQQATQIWNRSKSCGDFVIRKNAFTNIRRYGTVFRSKRGVIEDNTYSGNSARAVVFNNETDWPNGLYPSGIIIRNNRIFDSCFDHPDKPAAIGFLFNGYKCGAKSIGPRDILVEGNLFEDCPSPEISFTWTRNAVVRGNVVRHDGKTIPARISARNSEGIRHMEPSH